MSKRAACFWLSSAGIAWVLAGYPASLALLPRRRWRQDDVEPSVAIVVPAFREREELRAKLESIASIDYPAERVQVVVPVDDDPEVARVAEEAFPPALVLFSEGRHGKAAGMNRGVAATESDVLLLTDANNVLAPASLRLAVRHFADPDVWAVTGRRQETGSAYDRYEDLVRRLESRSGSVAGVFGEFIAVRRERLPRFPEDAVVDDLWLLLQLVRAGGRVVYEPGAATHEPGLDSRAEVARRSRMSAGRVMLSRELRGLPRDFAWRVVSHKWGRLALPVLLPAAFVSALTLSRSQPYRAAALVQAAGYGAGGLAIAGLRPPGPAGRVAGAAGQFVLGNVAVGVGLVRGLRRKQTAIWKPVR
jgi:poly-beta-1,6-N-acetyl-D-glucosamine synthase